MSTDTLARSTPPSTPSAAGDGVPLHLAGGQTVELRFSSRNIIKVENTFGSHLDFLVELERLPMNTLAWIISGCTEVKDDDKAIELLDGCNWEEIRSLVLLAWERANPPAPTPGPGEQLDPTQGS